MNEPHTRPSRTGGSASQDTIEDPDRAAYFGVSGVSQAEEDSNTPPATPRWVKWFGVAAIVLFLVIAGLHLTGLAPMHDMPMHSVQLP